MATLYLKSAGGNWSAAGTWSNTSAAGADNSGPPTASDNVIFELLSGNVTIDATSVCKSLSCTDGTGNYGGTLTHNAFNLTVSGSITFTSGMTYTPLATSTITLNAANTLTTAGKLLPLLALTSGLTTLGDNLSFMASRVITLALSGNVLDLNGKTVSGNSSINRILITSNTLGTARTITNTTGTFANADFRDITLSVAADLSAITGLSGDCGGNTNITFTPTATQTSSGTSGFSWSNAVVWTSRVPLPQDNVIINNAFSGGAQTITEDMPRLGKSIDFTGTTGTVSMQSSALVNSITVYGSLTLISGLPLNTNLSLIFEGRSSFIYTSAGGATPTSNANALMQMFGGTMTIQDAFSTNSQFMVLYGTFNANGFNVTCNNFSSSNSNTRGLIGGSGTWTITRNTASAGAWSTATTTGLTFNFTGTTIALTGTDNNNKGFNGGGLTYGSLIITGGGTGAWTFSQGNTWNNFTVGAPKTVIFQAGNTQTFNNPPLFQSSSGNVITIDSDTTSTHTLLLNTAGVVNADFLNIQHSIATPSNTWYAGNNSTNNQAVATAGSGWIFTSAPSGVNSFGGVVPNLVGTTSRARLSPNLKIFPILPRLRRKKVIRIF